MINVYEEARRRVCMFRDWNGLYDEVESYLMTVIDLMEKEKFPLLIVSSLYHTTPLHFYVGKLQRTLLFNSHGGSLDLCYTTDESSGTVERLSLISGVVCGNQNWYIWPRWNLSPQDTVRLLKKAFEPASP